MAPTDLQRVSQLLIYVKQARARGHNGTADARLAELHDLVEETGVEPADIYWRKA
jgi:hypothetical protein